MDMNTQIGIHKHWTSLERDRFAAIWPCCDVPSTGWAVFDHDTDDLVDISPNTRKCQPGGGISEFISELHGDNLSNQ